ncbi:TetR family transcriptional regulator [Sphaerisporangium siamense]|uniref:AcrR family transcriptional regulator n=1 Tax=Sphaerisporangium siamense TaxID=795645 RepID=A0A7W7G7G1_9ACTN|nr:TetR/AcrR family transcriptional regulator [Sphaerisporangium siamense]MBB4699097.1 AcrR family transcriptional regulator [Sphaerisporangium siamense]GII86776.1 TetR family transcriptional regulator [Sphaerisporangium siamense]
MRATTADRGREVRRRLLHVAAELIAERGWTAVSTRLIAERAGVTPGVVHYHFASMRALLAEAALGVIRDLAERLGTGLDQAGTPDEALGLIAGFLRDYDGTDPTSLLFAETYLAAGRDDDLRRALGEVVGGLRRRLADRLAAQGVAAPEATAATLIALIDGIVLHRALGPGPDAADLMAVLRRLVAPG